MQRPRPNHKAASFGASILGLILLTPLAAAASFPLLGTWEWGSMGGIAVAAGIVGLGIVLGLGILLGWIPVLGKVFRDRRVGIGLMSFGLLFGMILNPGALFNGADTPAASAAASSADAISFDAALYEPTTDLTLSFRDAEAKTAINPSVSIYPAGVDVKKALDGTATADYTGTASSGSLTLTGLDVQTIGCTVDVHATVSGYYEQVFASQNICTPKNALGNNDKSLATFYMENLGTQSLSLSDSSFTCAAAAQCTYSLRVRNSEDDSWLHGVAVKFADSDANNNHTLDAVTNGDCELVEVSGTQYIKFANNIGPLGVETCTVEITRESGDTDGTFTWTMDDYFTYYGATNWQTNTNILQASATSAYTVTFA